MTFQMRQKLKIVTLTKFAFDSFMFLFEMLHQPRRWVPSSATWFAAQRTIPVAFYVFDNSQRPFRAECTWRFRTLNQTSIHNLLDQSWKNFQTLPFFNCQKLFIFDFSANWINFNCCHGKKQKITDNYSQPRNLAPKSVRPQGPLVKCVFNLLLNWNVLLQDSHLKGCFFLSSFLCLCKCLTRSFFAYFPWNSLAHK